MSLVCSRGLLSAELALSERRDAESLSRLETYTALLDRWSRVQRLVGWKKASLLASEGLADSWAMVPALDQLPDLEIVDLGSGAGLPGMVLAIARPQRRVHLVEPRRKRVSFLREVRRELGLEEVRIHHGREEEVQGQLGAAPGGVLILARAFLPPDRLLERALAWNAAGCVLSLRSGQSWSQPGWKLAGEYDGRPAGQTSHQLLIPDSQV